MTGPEGQAKRGRKSRPFFISTVSRPAQQAATARFAISRTRCAR